MANEAQNISYAARVPFAEPRALEATEPVIPPTTAINETDVAIDDTPFLSYAVSATQRPLATVTHDKPFAPIEDTPAAAAMPEGAVPPLEPAIANSVATAVERVGANEVPTVSAEAQVAAIDEPNVTAAPPERGSPSDPAGDDGRSPQPARDWLLARMENAAAAHVGLAPPPSEDPVEAPSIAERVREVRPPVFEPAPRSPPPPAPPRPAYEERHLPPAFEPPTAPQPAHEPPPPPVDARPAYRAPEPQPEPIAVVNSAAGTFAPHEDPADVAPPAKSPTSLRSTALRVGRYAAYAAGGYLALVLALILVYRFVNPPASTLMLYEGLFGAGARQTWVPLDRISPNLVRAVIVAEDGRFCDHHGIDFAAIGDAIENADDFIPRGASTISMQVTKNLFLWQSKSYIRKLIEMPLTLIIEVVWPKSRVLEIYLNIAEWGPGVFGAEAAAQHHFNRSASTLSEREAAQLAASLPNPILRDAGDPGPRLQRKANVIQNRARVSGDVVFCVKSSR